MIEEEEEEINLEDDGEIKDASLAVMRCQPLHFGHIRLIDEAMKDRPVVLVLGSTQEHGTSRNPLTYSERKRMVKTYYNNLGLWNRMFVMGMPDTFSLDWADRVFEKIARVAPQYRITHVYGGTDYDLSWFEGYERVRRDRHGIGRNDPDYPYASGSMVRDMLMYKDARWMDHVPVCNWRRLARKFNRLDMLPDGVGGNAS